MTGTLNDIGDPGAPIGSPAWCKYAHIGLRENKHRTDSEVSSLKWGLRSFKQDGRYKQLVDRNGDQFTSWDRYVEYPEPWGLDMPSDVAQRVMEEKDEKRLVGDVLGRHGGNHGNQYTGGKRQVGSATLAPKEKNTVKHIIARLERDEHNELAAKVRAGELSANAAAIEAGFRKKPTTLEKILKLLPKLTPTERRQLRARLDEATKRQAA